MGKKEVTGFWGPRAGKLRPRHAIEVWEVGCAPWIVVFPKENVVRGMPLRSGKLSDTPATFVPRLRGPETPLSLFSHLLPIVSFFPSCLFFPILYLFSHIVYFPNLVSFSPSRPPYCIFLFPYCIFPILSLFSHIGPGDGEKTRWGKIDKMGEKETRLGKKTRLGRKRQSRGRDGVGCTPCTSSAHARR